ncbi:MAG: 4'-phosphopantetheinyl transferase superfamily protein [Terracidiphilus sp.]|jgi:4'-phosphopantetheinyl transferase
MLFPPIWPAAGIPQKIAASQIHVWAWLLNPPTGSGDHEKSQIGLLDAKELERFHGFHFENDRARFAIAHVNMRRILGAYLDREPKSVLFRFNSFGKPELVTEAQSPPLFFNLTHSRKIALLALSMDSELGIDIEDIRPIEPEIADSHFSPTELADLSLLEGEAWLKGFYNCWTRKEAILKAEGVGLNLPLHSFDVSLIPGLPAKLRGVRPPAAFRRPWTLHNLTTPLQTVAALAAGSPQAEVLRFGFEAALADSS